jgi:hypothetical protein
MNNRANPAAISDKESPLCSNIDLDQYGKICKRRGSSFLFSAARTSNVTWIGQHRTAAGVYKILFTEGTYLYSCDTDGTDVADITGTLTLTTGNDIHTSSVYCSISSAPYIVGTNNTNPLWCWNGSGNAVLLTTGGSGTYVPTAAKCVEWYDNYLICANVLETSTRYTNKFCWSAVNAPNDWSASSYILIGSAVDPIVGIVKFQKSIIVFKEHSVWKVVWDNSIAVPTFVPYVINPKIGCAAQATIAVTDNQIIWLSHDGVYTYDGRGTDEESVAKVSYQLEAESWSTNWHTTRKDYAHAVYYRHRDQYRLFITEGATQETAKQNLTYYAYHTQLKAWTKGTTSANVSAIIDVGSRQQIMVADYAKQINRLDYLNTTTGKYVDNDNGTKISAEWYSKDYTMGTPGLEKAWAELTVIMNSTSDAQTLTVTQYVNYGDYTRTGTLAMQEDAGKVGTFIIGTSKLGGGTTVQETLLLYSQSRVVRFKFSNNNLDEYFSIIGYTVTWESATHF